MFGKRPTSGNAAAVAERPAPAPLPVPPSAAPPVAPSVAVAEGGRTPFPSAGLGAPILATPSTQPAGVQKSAQQIPSAVDSRRSESYYEVKGTIFGALIEAIDLGQLAKLDADSAREEIRDIVNEIIAIKNIVMSISEQEDLLDDVCSASASSARSGAASMNPRRSAMPACPTARASTPSCHRWRSTVRRSPSASSGRTNSRSSSS